MFILVMKFGGILVVNLDCICCVVKCVGVEVVKGYDVIVIVLVMFGKINELVGWVNEILVFYDVCEYDVIVSLGENVIVGFMVLML